MSMPLRRSSVLEMHFPWAGDSIFLEKISSSRTETTCGNDSRRILQNSPFSGVWTEAYGYGLKSCKDLSGARWIRHAGGLPGNIMH